MSKLEQEQNKKKSQFGENLSEEEYERWIKEQFLKEAEEIEKGLGEVPDTEDWQPTEEKFQALLEKARERGLLENEDNPLTSTDGGNKKQKNNKKDSEESERANEKICNQKTKSTDFKRKVIKWTACAAATLVGVFGISMTSQASRAYVMEEVNKLFGNDINTEVDNDEVLDSDRTEKYANQDIENTLLLQMPRFHYLPSNMEYQNYALDADAHTAYLQYAWGEEIIYFRVLSNIETATRLSQNDMGREIEKIQNDLMQNLSITLWKIQEVGDENPTYSLRWEYKNSYYELFGKLPKEEMERIAKKIMY